ncbi:unnamed protein product [Caenorhabditis nigoni]
MVAVVDTSWIDITVKDEQDVLISNLSFLALSATFSRPNRRYKLLVDHFYRIMHHQILDRFFLTFFLVTKVISEIIRMHETSHRKKDRRKRSMSPASRMQNRGFDSSNIE